jgi:hypothetical protein
MDDARVTDDGPDPSDEEVLRLYTPDLTSKWGFHDGDLLLVDARTRELLEATGADSHDLLVAIVRELVLPCLDQRIELVDLVTLHNPARAASVDGVPLGSYGNPPDDHPPVEVSPDVVEVPMREVRALAARLAAGRA